MIEEEEKDVPKLWEACLMKEDGSIIVTEYGYGLVQFMGEVNGRKENR